MLRLLCPWRMPASLKKEAAHRQSDPTKLENPANLEPELEAYSICASFISHHDICWWSLTGRRLASASASGELTTCIAPANCTRMLSLVGHRTRPRHQGCCALVDERVAPRRQHSRLLSTLDVREPFIRRANEKGRLRWFRRPFPCPASPPVNVVSETPLSCWSRLPRAVAGSRDLQGAGARRIGTDFDRPTTVAHPVF